MWLKAAYRYVYFSLLRIVSWIASSFHLLYNLNALGFRNLRFILEFCCHCVTDIVSDYIYNFTDARYEGSNCFVGHQTWRESMFILFQNMKNCCYVDTMGDDLMHTAEHVF
jgi:hypothetical protein